MEIDGYRYHFQKEINNRRYYSCADKSISHCKARLIVFDYGDNSTTIELSGKAHNHPINDNPKETMLNKFKAALRLGAECGSDTMKKIYDEESKKHPKAAQIYSFSTAASLMRRARNKHSRIIPRTFDEMCEHMVDEKYKEKFEIHGRNFLRARIKANDGARVVIFSLQSLLDGSLKGCKVMGVDYSYDWLPLMPKMGNMFTLHLLKEDYMIPVMFGLMSENTPKALQAILSFFRDKLAPNFKPQTVVLDCEDTDLQKAVMRTYMQVDITTSWFYFCKVIPPLEMQHDLFIGAIQSVFKTARQVGLHDQNDDEVLMQLMALPLLPSYLIQEGFDLIVGKIETDSHLRATLYQSLLTHIEQ